MADLRENEFTERFWGRIPIESGAALFLFRRRSPLQQALHQLKYHHQGHIGVQLGRLLGSALKVSPYFQSVETILPVPLHPKKMRVRGYNQSALIAQGVSEILNIPVLQEVLVRHEFSESQTRKQRMERFSNVAEVFSLRNTSKIRGKHLLLVDDVLTTGATLEACGRLLLAVPQVRLSMATVAIAANARIL